MRIVGIDAGGSKTDFLLCDENENEIKRLTLGAGNPNDIGIDACLALLREGLSALCGDSEPDAVFAGVSGGGYGESALRIGSLLRELYPNSAIDNGTDAINLLYCSRSRGTVGALICGTGTALFVRKDQELHRFGGWGHLFDDGGSGYDLGRDALRFLLEAEESASTLLSSPLCSLLLERLGSSAHDALSSVYAGGKTYIASFAPLVFDALEQGDASALRIIERNVDALALRVSLAISTCGHLEELVCGGGLFGSPVFFDLLSRKFDIPLLLPDVPPVVGACRRAIEAVS